MQICLKPLRTAFCLLPNYFSNTYFSICLGIIWFTMLAPGNPTPDGYRSFLLAKSGTIDTWFSLPYGVVFFLLTLGGKTIIPLIIVQSTLLYWSLRRLLSICLEEKSINKVMSLVSLTPIFWIFAFTLYRDVLFCAGIFLMLSSSFTKTTLNATMNIGWRRAIFFIGITILLNMRQNAIIWVISFLFVAYLSKYFSKIRKLNLMPIAIQIPLSLSILTISYYAENTLPVTRDNGLDVVKHILFADLKCLTYNGEITLDVSLDLYGKPAKNIFITSENSGCSTIDKVYEGDLLDADKDKETREILSLWAKEFANSPLKIISIHMQRIWILFPQYHIPPFEDYELSIQILPNPPKAYLEPSVFLSVYDLNEGDLTDRGDRTLYLIAQGYGAVFNKMAFLFGNPFLLFILYLIVNYILCTGATYRSLRNEKMIWVIAVTYLVTLLSMAVASPAPDARFVYALLILEYCAILELASKMIKQRLSSPRCVQCPRN